jgi:hypothetical protein
MRVDGAGFACGHECGHDCGAMEIARVQRKGLGRRKVQGQ